MTLCSGAARALEDAGQSPCHSLPGLPSAEASTTSRTPWSCDDQKRLQMSPSVPNCKTAAGFSLEKRKISLLSLTGTAFTERWVKVGSSGR